MTSTLFDLDRIVACYRVSPDRLRLYEARGLLQPVSVDGTPCYTARDRVRLEIVLTGLRLGFSLGEITTMITGRLAAKAVQAVGSPVERDRIIDELRILLERQGGHGVSIDALKDLLRDR